MRLCLLPPGALDLKMVADAHFVDINLNGVIHDIAVDSDQRQKEFAPPDTLAFGMAGTSLSIATVNSLPGCYVEFADATLADWCERADLDVNLHPGFLSYDVDPVAAKLGRGAIAFLISDACGKSATDMLTAEAIVLAIGSRALARLEAGNAGSFDENNDHYRRRLDKGRIMRAVDWVEAHIFDNRLSIAEMSRVANLSPSHFAGVFKAAMGETPYQYILRRRAQSAHDLIAGTHEPLSRIAHKAGFSSQAHMNLVIKRQFGATPSMLRPH